MAKLEIDQSDWNALNRIISMAETRITFDLDEGFEKQQAEAALRVAHSILMGAEIEEPEYGIEEAEEERHNYERGD